MNDFYYVKKEVKWVNLKNYYGDGFEGNTHWVAVTDITESELRKVCSNIENYEPFVIISFYEWNNICNAFDTLKNNDHSVHNIIGEKRYQQLAKLNNTMIDTPLLCFDDSGKIPSINISLYYSDENERLILENIICNVVKKYLKIYGYSSEIICKWFVRYDLNMPYLQIYYAKTAEQRMALRAYIQNEQNNLVGQNVDLTDDTEDDDLNG